MKTISVHCFECGEHFFVKLDGDPPVPQVCSDVVAETERCPRCGTIQDVIGGWVQGQRQMQYLGQPVDGDQDDDDQYDDE